MATKKRQKRMPPIRVRASDLKRLREWQRVGRWTLAETVSVALDALDKIRSGKNE